MIQSCALSRSKRDPILYVVREHESDKLSKSFQQLDLFTESSSDIVSVITMFLLDSLQPV